MSDNIVRRAEGADGGAVYTFAADADTEGMITSAAEFHQCEREAIIATAIGIYVAAFHESLSLALAARGDGKSH